MSMCSVNVANIKQHYFDGLVKTINVEAYVNILHCSTTGGLFSNLIKIGSYLKRREGCITHTSMIYANDRKHPRIGEADVAIGSYTHCALWDSYFKGLYKGKIILEELKLPRPLTQKEKNDSIYFVEHIQHGKKYSVQLALGSFFDIFKDQQDRNIDVYCTDSVLDYIDYLMSMVTDNKNYKLCSNNAEKTPAELYNDELYTSSDFEEGRRRVIFDSEKSWDNMIAILDKDKKTYNL